MIRPDPLQLPETGDPKIVLLDPGLRLVDEGSGKLRIKRDGDLDGSTHVIAGAALVAFYIAAGLLVGIDKVWAFIAGGGAMGVGVLVARWMERLP